MYDHFNFERQLTHMTKNDTTQVLDKYPPPLPELTEHPAPYQIMLDPALYKNAFTPTIYFCQL